MSLYILRKKKEKNKEKNEKVKGGGRIKARGRERKPVQTFVISYTVFHYKGFT
jgi:hypothetical protein